MKTPPHRPKKKQIKAPDWSLPNSHRYYQWVDRPKRNRTMPFTPPHASPHRQRVTTCTSLLASIRGLLIGMA